MMPNSIRWSRNGRTRATEVQEQREDKPTSPLCLGRRNGNYVTPEAMSTPLENPSPATEGMSDALAFTRRWLNLDPPVNLGELLDIVAGKVKRVQQVQIPMAHHRVETPPIRVDRPTDAYSGRLRHKRMTGHLREETEVPARA